MHLLVIEDNRAADTPYRKMGLQPSTPPELSKQLKEEAGCKDRRRTIPTALL
jgi:hypothetical protein